MKELIEKKKNHNYVLVKFKDKNDLVRITEVLDRCQNPVVTKLDDLLFLITFDKYLY